MEFNFESFVRKIEGNMQMHLIACYTDRHKNTRILKYGSIVCDEQRSGITTIKNRKLRMKNV